MFDLTIQDFNGEPRMRDIEIAEALGFARSRDFRKLIDRCSARLMEFGDITRATLARFDKYNPDAEEYWLNEHQAFYICTQSKASKAFEVTRQIINLFVAWRNGQIPALPEGPAEFQVTPDTPTHLALVREVRLTKGIEAAREIYDRLPLPRFASAPQVPPQSKQDGAILLFLQDCCVISGDVTWWTRSRDLYCAYLEFSDEAGAVLGPRGFANRMLAVSDTYQDPVLGGRFWPRKRSDTGYCGIQLSARH